MAKKTKLSKSSLHWFIRSRPYVLLAELRRRFDLDGSDEVRAIRTAGGTTYVGLPERAAHLIEDLVRENRVGLECTAEVHARLAIGVYAYDLLKAPIGLQRSNPFMRPPNAGRPDAAGPDEAPDEGDEPTEGEESDVNSAAAAPPEPGRPPDRPRFERTDRDRRLGDRRQGDRRDFGRPRGGPPGSAPGAAERRPGARPDLPRRDRPGRPDLPQPRPERSRPGGQPRLVDPSERRSSDRPERRSGRP